MFWQAQDIRGESHHFTLRGKRIVVDLGIDGGPKAVKFDPDIVILTHSDRDHIGGATAYLNGAGHRPSRELWVPYEWGVLTQELQAAVGYSFSSDTKVEDYEDTLNGIAASATLPDDARSDGRDRMERDDAEDPPGWEVESVDSLDLDGIDENVGSLIERGWPNESTEGESFGSSEVVTVRGSRRIAQDIYDKSTSLGAILADAQARGFRIRWFSHDHEPRYIGQAWRTEGEPGLVTIVNATEVLLPRRTISPRVAWMFAALELTIQNKRALVTFVWPEPDLYSPGGVIVWSDGDGSHCDMARLPWRFVDAMTAPHHGSEGIRHSGIWWAMRMHAPSIDVVMAGGTRNKDLHPSFLELSNRQRACTICRGPGKGSVSDAAVDWPTWSRTCSIVCRDVHP